MCVLAVVSAVLPNKVGGSGSGCAVLNVVAGIGAARVNPAGAVVANVGLAGDTETVGNVAAVVCAAAVVAPNAKPPNRGVDSVAASEAEVVTIAAGFGLIVLTVELEELIWNCILGTSGALLGDACTIGAVDNGLATVPDGASICALGLSFLGVSTIGDDTFGDCVVETIAAVAVLNVTFVVVAKLGALLLSSVLDATSCFDPSLVFAALSTFSFGSVRGLALLLTFAVSTSSVES